MTNFCGENKGNKLPQWVEIFKDKGKNIKVRNGRYYLYAQKCTYDNTKKHNNTTKDTYLGRITKENGLIPPKAAKTIASTSIISKTYGPYAVIKYVAEDIYEGLKKHFGGYANLLFTIAALRTVENTPYCELEDGYNSSYFSVYDKTLSMSKSCLSDFLVEFSKFKDKMILFMNEDLDKNDIVIIDGTNLYCGSHNISYVASGYKHGHNYRSQVNVMYAYSAKKHKPAYYKLFEGSITDRSTLEDFLKEAKIKNSYVLIDNGFESPKSLKSLLVNKNKYIMALRRDSKYVTEAMLEDGFRVNSKEKFTYNNEAVYGYEESGDNDNERICVFFNHTIAAVEAKSYLEKIKKKWKGYTDDGYKKECRFFGMLVLKTNVMHFTLKKIYEYYKVRFEIEYMFDTIKNTYEIDNVYLSSDEALESWMFINHLTISITYNIFKLLKNSDMLSSLSPRKLFKKLRQVIIQRNILDKTESYELQIIPAKTEVIIGNLGIPINV
jgi:hypothetical protein